MDLISCYKKHHGFLQVHYKIRYIFFVNEILIQSCKKEGLEILDENTVDHNFQAEDLCRANRVAMAVNPIPVKTKDRQSLPS